ncbi:MAG: GNAT family N-acetyltransferase [Granulosicoccaceae bacterium]
MPKTSITLDLLGDSYSLIKLPAEAPCPLNTNSDQGQGFTSVSRSSSELSIICPTRITQVWDKSQAEESSDWYCLRLSLATEPSQVPGIIDAVVSPLAAAKISVFVVSTFDTDHLLVKQIDAAKKVLSAAGHRIVETKSTVQTASKFQVLPSLETQRLCLRSIRASDFEAVATFFAHKSSGMYGGPCDRDTAWRKFAAWFGHWTLRGYGPLGIERKDSGEFIGWTGPWYPQGWPEPEITWALLPHAQGQGFATEAAGCALGHVFNQLQWPTAISVIDDRNKGSLALAQRLGATAESKLELFGHPATLYRHAHFKST